MTTASGVPLKLTDPTNTAILALSEDKLEGFQRDPFGEISRRSGVPLDTVLERIRALLEAGTIRRVRQTLLSTNLADGALIAWQVPQDKLSAAFDFMFQQDPFSGHVVTRSTDAATPACRASRITRSNVGTGSSCVPSCCRTRSTATRSPRTWPTAS